MRAARTLSVAFATLVIALCLAPPIGATNGMYLTGYGAEVVGRGGANLAISDRTLAINFNPAGIAQLQGNHLSLNISLLAPTLTFENAINQPVDGNDQIFPLPAVAYVRGNPRSPWAWGLGFVAQGGMGARFERTNTFFGTIDETFSEVRFATVVPTVAYAFSEDFSLGAALNVGWGDVAFRFFPQTSFFNQQDPVNSFFGVDMDPAGGFLYNLRVGAWWRPHPRFSVGLVYQTETESEFDGGDMRVNFGGHPFLGVPVNYDAEVDGFTFAAQAGIGFALRASPKWMVALDVKRYFWDDAIDVITVTARQPDVVGAPPQIVLPFVFEWRDQWVYAVGVECRTSDRLTLRAGYNFGENPVPDATLNPLFPATVEHHATIGASWLRGHRTWELAIEHAFENDSTNFNSNPQVNPFGPGSRVTHEQWTLSFGVSWAWERKVVP